MDELKKKLRILVLSGGGMKGSYQLGAIKALRDHGYVENFDIVSGVSVGALNGAMVAQGKYDTMLKLWYSIIDQPSKIFTSPYLNEKAKFSVWKTLKTLAGRLFRGESLWNEKGILRNDPLREILRKNVSAAEMKSDFLIGFVSLYDGQYYAPEVKELDNDEVLIDAILASTIIPLYWPPIPEIPYKDSILRDCVDGGVREISPLHTALEHFVNNYPDHEAEIIVINCNTINDYYEADNILSIALRSFEIARDEIQMNDTVYYNSIPGVTVHVIQPEEPLGFDTLNFTEEAAERGYWQGYEDAEKLLSDLDVVNLF